MKRQHTRIEYHSISAFGSVGCEVTIVVPIVSFLPAEVYICLFCEAEEAKTRKHVLNGATMVPLGMSTFRKLGPDAEGYLQNLATVANSTGGVDRGVWLSISRQYLSFALVRGRRIVFRHYYRSLAKKADKDYCDGANAIVPFE
jgi:hypothetical protein